MSKNKDSGRVENKPKPRPVVKVFECYRKANGALGLRAHWEDA